MNNDNSFGDRQMFKGDWSCSECGAKITELPFEPSGDKPLLCRDCHRQKRDSRRNFGERKMFQGNWKCSKCGMEITELPFRPQEGQEILCRNCYLSEKNQ